MREQRRHMGRAETPGGVVQHSLQLVPFAHRALRSRNHGRSPRCCRRHSKFVHTVCSVNIRSAPTNAARSPRRLVPTRPAVRKPNVEGRQTVEQTGLALARLRQLGPLTDDNLLIFRDRTPKGRHYTERPGDPPTGLQDSSFGAGCFGNTKSS